MQVLVVGGEDGVMRILDLRADKAQQSFQVHATRVRGVAPLLPERTSSSEAADSAAQLVGTAASDGLIRLWDLRSTGAPIWSLENRKQIMAMFQSRAWNVLKPDGSSPTQANSQPSMQRDTRSLHVQLVEDGQ